MNLNEFWFVLVGILLTGYALLDGYDLGTGPLLLCTKSDHERKLLLDAVGPIWNGNELWLVAAIGALFAVFPQVYFTVRTGFYDLFTPLLVAFVARAAAVEFRGIRRSSEWRTTWDAVFAVSSTLSVLLLGIAFGNIIGGIPLDSNRDFQGNLFSLLHPYAVFTGFTTVSLFVMYANVFLVLKTDGPLQANLMHWARFTVPAYLVCFIAIHVMTVVACPQIGAAFRQRPWIMGIIFIAGMPVTTNILISVWRNRPRQAFMSACAALVLHLLLYAAALYPNLVFSTADHTYDLNIYNSTSTEDRLRFMFVVAIIGVPILLSYTITMYYAFRRRVVRTEKSY